MSGGIAMFDVVVRLTVDEAQRYREEGEPFTEDLAYEVAKNPSAYRAR